MSVGIVYEVLHKWSISEHARNYVYVKFMFRALNDKSEG